MTAVADATVFVPRVPFAVCERHVDYLHILHHIQQRRTVVERATTPIVRRLAWQIVNGKPHDATTVALTDKLAVALDQTATFGYHQARAEIASLRRAHPHKPRAAVGGYQFPDAGRHARIATHGIDAVRQFIRHRAVQTSTGVYHDVLQAPVLQKPKKPPLSVQAAALAAVAARSLHNHVLELVGETLNLGRTAGVATMNDPPEFALRSEQLDANTCDPCEQLHGEIVEIGSPEYYDLMPPAECDGGGRCRGIYVYGDTPGQMEAAA